MSLRLKLDPLTVTMKSGKSKKDYKVSTGGKVTLESRGGTALPPSPFPLKIEFHELAGKGDKEKLPRLIATLEGEFTGSEKAPKVDLKIAQLQRETLVDMSDFRIQLDFESSVFENPFPVYTLKLPWEVEGEGGNHEVGAKLFVDGSLHADIKQNDTLDLILKHPEVPEDGVSTSVFLDHFGIDWVYPDHNHMFSGKQRMAIGSNAVNVFLHESVKNGVDGIHTGSYSLTDITAEIKAILNDAGFSTVNVSEKTTADSTGSNGPWQSSQAHGRFIAQNVADPNAVAANEGKDIPFFDYWVFYETGLTHGGEAGRSEALNPGNLFNSTAVTKRVITPIALVGGGGEFDSTYSAVAKTADRPIFLATLIAHEIGHSLGLHHGIQFDTSAKAYVSNPQGAKGVMTSLLVDGGSFGKKRFNPVNKKLIGKHFL